MEAANDIPHLSSKLLLQHQQLWLAKGAEVCQPQTVGDMSGCHLIPAAAVIVLHCHRRCYTSPVLDEQRRGTIVETTCSVIDCILICLVP